MASVSPVPQLQTVDAPRGVYRTRSRLGGEPIYYAVTSSGHLVDTCRTRVGELDADVVTHLADLLDAVDAIEPRHLKLG